MSSVGLVVVAVMCGVGAVLIAHSLSAPGTSYGEIIASRLRGDR